MAWPKYHTHACTHARTHSRTHPCTHARTHARAHAHNTCTHAHTHARTYARTHAHTYACMHAHTHTHTSTHANAYTRAYTLMRIASTINVLLECLIIQLLPFCSGLSHHHILIVLQWLLALYKSSVPPVVTLAQFRQHVQFSSIASSPETPSSPSSNGQGMVESRKNYRRVPPWKSYF